MLQGLMKALGAPQPPPAAPPQPCSADPNIYAQQQQQYQQQLQQYNYQIQQQQYQQQMNQYYADRTGAPTPPLSCDPALADVGQTLAITYNCSSGVASSSAFKVTTQPGGSATTTVKTPPRGPTTATHTLACTD